MHNRLKLLMIMVSIFLFCDKSHKPFTNTPGYIDTLQGIRVLFLSGDHYSRGYDHGYLLSGEILQSFQDIVITHVCNESDSLYSAARAFILEHFIYEETFRREAAGMIAGMKKRGASLHNPALKRDIDSMDILILNTLEEMYTIVQSKGGGCSSIATWGSGTMSDTSLKGDLVITRHWDYERIPSMINNFFLIVHHPEESEENGWVNIGFAGSIGAAGAMDEHGSGAFLNYAVTNEPAPNVSTHYPVSLSIRKSIEQRDCNNDGRHSFRDLLDNLNQYTPYFGSIVHFVSTWKSDSCAVVIESNNQNGTTFRTKYDNTNIQGDYLAATNHFRVLKPPVECVRYTRILDSLSVSLDVGFDRSWTLLAGAGASSFCTYSITYVPARRTFRLSTAVLSDPTPAYERPSARFSLGDLLKTKAEGT